MKRIFKEEEQTFKELCPNLSTGINPSRIPVSTYPMLAKSYEEITKRLNSNFESITTHSENTVFNKLQKFTKLQIHRQVWIGSRCFDFFIPSVRGNSPVKSRGLAIEIDGPIHNTISKMKKDDSKDLLAKSLGIMVHSIPNDDSLDKVTLDFLSRIKDMPRLSYREYRRLWAKIHLRTIELRGTTQDKAKIISLTKGLL